MTWKLITSKQYQILSRFWVLQAFRDTMKDLLGFGVNDYKVVNNYTYIDKETFQNLTKFLIKKFEQDKEYFSKIAKKWFEYCERLKKITYIISKIDYTKINNPELYGLLITCIDEFKYTMAYVLIPHAVEDHFEKLIRELLKKRIKNEKLIEKYLRTITSNIKPTLLSNIKKELSEIAVEIKENNIPLNKLTNYDKINKKITTYANKYKWLNYDTGLGKDIEVDEVIERIKVLLSKGIIESEDQSEDEYDKIIKKLSLNPQEKKIIDITQELIFMRELRIESMAVAGCNIRPLLEHIGRRINLSYGDLIYLTPKEINKDYLERKLI